MNTNIFPIHGQAVVIWTNEYPDGVAGRFLMLDTINVVKLPYSNESIEWSKVFHWSKIM